MTTRASHHILLLTAALLAVDLSPRAPCPGPRPALADEDDPEVTKMAKQHFQLGLDAYKSGKYDVAIKELKKAYLLKRLPAILLNIGLTYRKTREYDLALYFYRKYLQEVPPDDKQRPLAETAIAEIEAEKKEAARPAPLPQARPAVEAAKEKPAPAPAPLAEQPAAPMGPPAPAAPPAEGMPAAPVTEWTHVPLDAVPPGQPVDVRVQMPVMKGVKVRVFFRREGQASFESLELKRHGNEKLARLPASVTQGRTFQYYVEARDPAGTLVKSSGSEASPNVVLIDNAARPQLAGAAGAAEGEDEEAQKPKRGFSRDIENEAVTFGKEEPRSPFAAPQAPREGRPRKPLPFGTLGVAGLALIGAGVLAGAGGFALLGLAKGRADAVSSDSTCAVMKSTSAGPECPHFGDNSSPPGPGLPFSPSSASYDRQGRAFNTAGEILAPIGGALALAGAAMTVADVIVTQRARQREAERLHPKPKKRKIKKVIEVEEETLYLGPVLGPATVGLAGGLQF